MPRYPRLTVALFLLLLVSEGSAQDLSLPAGEPAPWPNTYTDRLAEQLADRGAAELASGKPALATRSLLEANQAIKINHGLHSTRQIPILELLINSHLALGDWAAIDTQVAYFEWLNERNVRTDLEAYLEGTRALSDLLLAASADRNNPASVRHLVQAKNLNWRAVSAIETNLGKDSPLLAFWFYRLTLNHFYQASLIRRRHLTSYAFKTDGDEIVSGWALPYNESVDMSYRIGRELLQRIADLQAGNADAPREAAALALVYQGDWELLFDRRDRALNLYRRAHGALRDLNGSAAADRFFERPLVLPASELLTSFSGPESDAADDNGTHTLEVIAWSPVYPGVTQPAPHLAPPGATQEHLSVRARFNLLPVAAESGTAASVPDGLHSASRELTLLTSEPDNPQVRELALAQLQRLHLRPRLAAGTPALGREREVEIIYRFTPQQGQLAPSDNQGEP